MTRPTRLSEYREGGFGPHFRRWLLMLYREAGTTDAAGGLLARASLDVREDPDNPGCLLVAVRGAVRVTHDGRDVEHRVVTDAAPPLAARWALSVAARASSRRRRCPSCSRDGGLSKMADGSHQCRWCKKVVGLEVAA